MCEGKTMDTNEVTREKCDLRQWHLRAVLRALGVSQGRLGRLLGLSASKISRLVNGRHCPSWTTAIRVATVLRVPLDVLAGLLPVEVCARPWEGALPADGG